MVVAALVLTGAASRAQFYEFTFPGESSFDGWENLNSSTFPYGWFPGSAAWPGPVGSNAEGSGDADLIRVAGANGGGPFFASDSLYFGGVNPTPNTLGGTLRVADATPVAGVRTIVFQIQTGEAYAHDFHLPSGLPVLKLNGSTNGVVPASIAVLNRFYDGEFDVDEDQSEAMFVNTWGFEWHLPEGEVTSFAIDFSAVMHARIHRMRLDQSSAVVTSGVFLPELAMGVRGTPVFNGATTSVTHSFRATPGALLKVEYRESLASGSWTSAGLHSVANDGSLSLPFTASGDRRAEWSRRMFFRAYHPAAP